MAILKLPVTRFICQHSIGCSRSKYAYLAMQKDLEEALKSCAWRESVAPATTVTLTVNQLTKTDAPKDADGRVIGQSSYTAYLDDKYTREWSRTVSSCQTHIFRRKAFWTR